MLDIFIITSTVLGCFTTILAVKLMILGRARFTMDIEIILDHTKLNREDFVNFLEKNNFDASLSDLEGLDEKSQCTFFYRKGMFRIDIKGVYSDLEKESINMPIEGIYNDIKLKIDNPVNIVLFKHKFGSEQDYEDALAVFIW